ncbi:MAG TPA: dihydrolipoyllysine-residue succinyltransferase [Cryomorphaceae bacterium]|nr:dihydrolipoyllysine-residue succinyltransferase [Owenweeksia sp.]MBF97776.1 dihydrolipoyllysine-residue succinyltransferase [Owenweeksia sp.]HAD95756.1 dihydrolipoyllysine-residue succinyltransferase [Cryomorphaceae bacterium]|tara:strand:+ start:1557 stop:2843 length:1287 start_codon:yes stop_codon:yes gene_type:complete
MSVDIKVPSPGESVSEVEIAQWLVSDGDYVEKDQEIVELDSDKATLALPAEESGVISISVEEGESVEVGQVIGTIDTDAAKPDGGDDSDSDNKKEKKEESKDSKEDKSTEKEMDAKKESKDEDKGKAPAKEEKTYASGVPSPAARKILDEKEIDPKEIKGSGKDGRITKEDAVKAEASMGSPTGAARNSDTKRMSSLRRKLAQRLVSVKNETAMLTTFNEVDMKPIFDLRAKYKEEFKEKHGVSLGFMSFFTKAVVRALKEFPQVNSMIDGDNLVTFDYQDISIAVSGPKGLMVPVIRNAENLTFAGIEKEIKRLATRVRDGEITVDEMTGGTFTITNGGVFGSMLSTPIINPPQSAILGMHNIVERPVAIDGKIDVRPIMYVALSYDHRVIDGRESVGFLVNVKEALENPEEHLMGGDSAAERALEI